MELPPIYPNQHILIWKIAYRALTTYFFLGNMGYPVITRLGINQFWYNHWYSDTIFFLNSKQDKSLLKLFKIYLNYGITFPTSLFFHEFYFRNSYKHIRSLVTFKNWKFFRKVYFSCTSLEIEHSYFLRKKSSEFFPLRFWLLRYSKWIILLFSCFKPLKFKDDKGAPSLIKKETHSVSPRLSAPTNLTRLKILLTYIKLKLNFNYSF